jgi:hypothetical protein
MHAAIETVFAKPRPPALDPPRATATHIQDTPLLAYHQGCTRPPDPNRNVSPHSLDFYGYMLQLFNINHIP